MCPILKTDYQKPVKLLSPILQAQSKMKMLYDKNAHNRNFEPGDKVLALLLIPDDDSSLNLLQYVSDFKNRLSKACEAAQSNLTSSKQNENAL